MKNLSKKHLKSKKITKKINFYVFLLIRPTQYFLNISCLKSISAPKTYLYLQLSFQLLH